MRWFRESFLEIVEKIWTKRHGKRSVVVCVGALRRWRYAVLRDHVEDFLPEREASMPDTSDDDRRRRRRRGYTFLGRETSDAREIARIGSKSSRASASERRETREKVFANSRRRQTAKKVCCLQRYFNAKKTKQTTTNENSKTSNN